MRSLNELKQLYIKAITSTMQSEDFSEYIEEYTPKQQKILIDLKSSIESLKDKRLNKTIYTNKVNSWIDNTAYRFARDVYNLLECYEIRDMDHSYGDGSHTKGATDYYEILIPTDDFCVFALAGLTVFSDWNERV